tara:strand:+ start:3056 stop:4723 length:1668 start_codon:yes stop_codon:yes gene_type:complete
MIYKDIDYKNHRKEMESIYGVDTMCTAKFLSGTIYLQTGQTHSCYHPLPHYISLDEIQDNPSAIHNTSHKKAQRKKMLCGERPEECNYCWRIEDLKKDHLSDRIIKSKNELLISADANEHIKKHGWNLNYIPTYLELSFANECNQKCFYCHPKASSRWQKEMEEHGEIPNAKFLQRLHETIYTEDNNPYLDAFWNWWPELSTKIKVLRLTGGEPLIQKSIWKFLDMLEDHSNPDLIFQLNSNLNVKPQLVEKLVDKVNWLLRHDKISKFALHTSLESWGPKAEYARYGLDLKLWENNLKYVINNIRNFKYGTKDWTNPCSTIHIMNTFNVLSVTSYKLFLEKILEWRQEFAKDNGVGKIYFDIPHATEPSHVTLSILPGNYLKYFEEIEEYMIKHWWKNPSHKGKWFNSHKYHHWFTTEEIEQFKRVKDYFVTGINQQSQILNKPKYLEVQSIDNARANFYNFVKELDKRRNTSFLNTFPEMKDFFNICANVADDEFYCNNIEHMLKRNNKIEFHLDDMFYKHRPELAKNLLEYRKEKQYRTWVYNNNELQYEIR